MATRYFKKHQRNEVYSYYKVLSDRQPPVCERIIFLNERPAIDLSEYDLTNSGSRIDYQAIEENGDPIDSGEYEAAYKQATAGEFTLYINGQLQVATKDTF